MDKDLSITVLGAGSWGSALACHLARNGHNTTLWGRDVSAMESMQINRENTRYLPGEKLHHSLVCTHKLDQSVASSQAVLVATPVKAIDTTLKQLLPVMHADQYFIWACKGIEANTGKLLHDVFRDRLPASMKSAVISGPSFAGELIRNLPTAITVASFEHSVADQVALWLHGENLRAYSTNDVIGVEVGGALKNVFAIAAGISDGLGFGANARAALVTRGLAELMRLGVAMGARSETLMGLSGMGDLVLTCTDDQSRNRRFGLALSDGMDVSQALEKIAQVVEGVRTTKEACLLANKFEVDMPIVEQVYDVIYHSKPPKIAVSALLSRSPKQEFN